MNTSYKRYLLLKFKGENMKKILLLLFITGCASAAPVQFDFVFADPNSSAQTTGYIILETDLLSNPGYDQIQLPNPAVIDLQLTVTGSAFSDGSYDITDYGMVLFGTNGGTLDFSQPLIGQATSQDPWGTNIFDGNSGEFNLLIDGFPDQNPEDIYNNQTPSGVIAGPPEGCFYFTLCEDFGNDNAPQGLPPLAEMQLQSFIPSVTQGTPVSVPSLSFWAVIMLAFGLLTVVLINRKNHL